MCNGTDEALLKSQPDNEKTILLTRWFNCVKLPVDVMTKADHPFHALFDGDSPPHLLVCDFDGGNLRPLESERSRTELWDVLTETVKHSYKKDARASLKKLAQILDELDQLDEKSIELEADFEQTIEKKGPDARKLKKLRADMKELSEERKGLMKEFEKNAELELIRRTPAVPADAGHSD